MRSTWYFVPFFAMFLLPLGSGFAKSQAPVEVLLQPHSNGRLIVAAKVNGEGPYPFLIDTGASITLLDRALFRELGLRTEGQVALAGIKGESAQDLGMVDEVSVNGLSVSPLNVLSVRDLEVDSIKVRGILGENFLSHFDLLIDNQHGRISLDRSGALVNQLAGERLPITFDSATAARGLKARPTVAVTLPAYGSTPLTLLLDSASDTVLVRAPKNRRRTTGASASEIKVTMHSVYGTVECASWEDELRWGKFHANGVRVTACSGPVSDKLGNEGSLPTSAFKQIFVSHSGSFVVLNPSRRTMSGPEVAGLATVPARNDLSDSAGPEGTQ